MLRSLIIGIIGFYCKYPTSWQVNHTARLRILANSETHTITQVLAQFLIIKAISEDSTNVLKSVNIIEYGRALKSTSTLYIPLDKFHILIFAVFYVDKVV